MEVGRLVEEGREREVGVVLLRRRRGVEAHLREEKRSTSPRGGGEDLELNCGEGDLAGVAGLEPKIGL